MIKIEDFENAPVGATATRADGHRAMKINDGVRGWIAPKDSYLSDKGMAHFGYTLDPTVPATAREALDMGLNVAWDLAHEVKEGQVIPEGAWLVERRDNKITVEKNTFFDITVDEWGAENIRTVEPLPDPKPDWLNAPAVLAYGPATNLLQVWVKDNQDTGYYKTITNRSVHYVALNDVTPLYPKEGEEK